MTAPIATTLPSDLQAAMSAVDIALNERARIEMLLAELGSARPSAVEAAEAAQATLNLAQADALLAGPPETALPAALAAAEATLRSKSGRDVGTAVRRAEEARSAAEAAAAVVARIDRATEALNAKLADTDVEIEAAAAAFSEAVSAAQAAAREAWAGELREATRALAKALRKGCAVAAAYRYPAVAVMDTVVPNPVHYHAPYLSHGTLALGDAGPERLEVSWRDDPAAVALHDAHAPVRVLQDRLRPHTDRIRRQREDQRLAAAERARTDSRRPSNASYQDRQPAPPPAPPGPRFVPNSWADRGVMTPTAELNRVHGIADAFAPMEAQKPAV